MYCTAGSSPDSVTAGSNNKLFLADVLQAQGRHATFGMLFMVLTAPPVRRSQMEGGNDYKKFSGKKKTENSGEVGANRDSVLTL